MSRLKRSLMSNSLGAGTDCRAHIARNPVLPSKTPERKTLVVLLPGGSDFRLPCFRRSSSTGRRFRQFHAGGTPSTTTPDGTSVGFSEGGDAI